MESANQTLVREPLPHKPTPCRFDLATVQKCRSLSRRTGKPCRQPAMANGRCRFHGGKAGAPKGNRNAWKHGGYSAEAQAERRELRQLLREARDFLDDLEELDG